MSITEADLQDATRQHSLPCAVSAPRAAPENTKKNSQVKPNKTRDKTAR